MTTIQTFKSQSPYFDDFDPAKDYIQVLFRPGYPVQARELTTLQTFLQEQVGRFGDSMYRDASIVRSAELTYDSDVYEMVLTGSGSSVSPASGAVNTTSLSVINNLVGGIISNERGSVKARVLPSPAGVTGTSAVGNIYIKYITDQEFSSADYIYSYQTDNPDNTADYYNTFSSVAESRLVSIDEGVFYFRGRFIRVGTQSIVVPTNSFNVGFAVTETIVTPYEDSTLFDNARGSTNEGAPGAHRQKYTLELTYRSVGSSGDNSFYRVATFLDGQRQEISSIDDSLTQIQEILARRTYDESGDYALRPFNCTLDNGDSEANFELTIAPSKAYVKGYEIEKTSPTKVYLDRLSDTKTTRNNKTPIIGTTSLEVTGVSGTLPGSQSGQPFTVANRLQLKNSAGDVIGVARAWAVKDSFKRGTAVTKLYFFDTRMFTIVDTGSADFESALVDGDVVTQTKTKGSVFNAEGQAGLTGFTIIGKSGAFRANNTISSERYDSEVVATTVTEFNISQVATIEATNGFSATVTANTFENENSSLFVETSKHIKTLKDASTSIMDNDFKVLEDTGGAATVLNAANGFFDETRVDDEAEIPKTLKFGYLKVSNTTAAYGWSAAYKEISLHYPDIYKVYKINESTDTTFDNARFTRLNITTAGVIPQGAIIVGDTSETKAIVALTNSSSINENTLGSGAFHLTRDGTGVNSNIEVVFTEGTSFTASENLTVHVPGSENAFTYSVTYNSATAAVGSDITGLYQLDNGQRNEYYDIGRLVRKSNSPKPNNDILVFFSYFEADPSTNHYYSTDSYSGENFYRVDSRYVTSVQDIKPVTEQVGGNLRNGFDFRLRVIPVTNTSQSPFNFAYRVFHEQDRIVPDTLFSTDVVEYIGRIDAISLQKNGDIIIIPGVPSNAPRKPKSSVDGMVLYYVSIPPTVRYPETDVIVEKLDNRRYTMRDIGELEKRIDRVETSVSLSLLENQALQDDVDGRSKSGFVSTDFTLSRASEDQIGDVQHSEYNATIDVLEQRLIPAQTDGVPLDMTVSSTANISTFFNGYYLKDFTEEAFSTQLDATTSQRINPFATWIYNGDVTLNPSEDNWRIRKDDYFTSLYGQLKPFSGSDADFEAFSKITTSSPGGRGTTVSEWIGRPTVSTQRLAGQRIRRTTTQALRTTTNRTFDKPRATGQTTSTLTGSKVIENPQDYFMRSVTITYTASNLKPSTLHNIKFGEKILGTATSDASGDLSGTITVPAQTFKAGTQTVSLNDADTGVNSEGYASFKSIGHEDTFKTVAQTATSIVTKSTGIAVRSSTVERRRERNRDPSVPREKGDPIAQMFMLPNIGTPGSVEKQVSVITSIDLWLSFVDVKPSMDKIKVEIRETINGYPSGPSGTIGTTGFVNVAKGNQTDTISDATAFNAKFLAPIVLRGGVEYSIVIKTPSSDTAVYVAQMGEQLIDGSGIHSSQPNVGGYFGSFFKSQNQTTWTADQNKDMTYRLYRAKFVDDDATISMINTIQDTGYFKGDIGAYNEGLAMETFTGCDYVRVFHPNHGMNYNNSQVTISGVGNGSLTFNGISDSDLNGTFDVKYATLDSYFIKLVSARATASGKINTGTFTTFATQDIMYDSLLTNFMATKEEGDEVDMSINTTITSPVKLVVDNNKIANESTITPYNDTLTNYQIDDIIEFEDPRIVRSQTNANGNDLTINLTLRNGSQYTSPIIKTGSNLNPILFRNITGLMLNDSDIEGLTRTTLGTDSDDDIQQEYISYLQAVKSEEEHSAWVTKQIDLEIPADGFTIKFEADMEPTSKIEAAYKVRAIGDDTPFEELEWIDFPYAQQITELNYGEFSSDLDYKGFTMRAESNFDFSSFKLRLRMGTENEAQIPSIKNLRIIADV